MPLEELQFRDVDHLLTSKPHVPGYVLSVFHRTSTCNWGSSSINLVTGLTWWPV